MTSSTTAEYYRAAEQDLMEAVATLWAEHDRVMKIVMSLVDLVEDVQTGTEQVHAVNFRKATAKTLRDSIAVRDAALAPFGISSEDAAGSVRDGA